MSTPIVFPKVEDIALYVGKQRVRYIDKEVNQPNARWVTILWRYRRHGEATDHAMLARYEYSKEYQGYIQLPSCDGFDLGRPDLFRWVAGLLWKWYQEGPAYDDKAMEKIRAGQLFAATGSGEDEA